MKDTIMRKEIAQQPELMKTLATAQNEVYTEIAAQLRRRKIKSVVFAARGSSDHASIFGQYLMARCCGAVVALATPSSVTAYGATPDYSKSMVIGVSQSGEGEDVIAVVKAAKDCGALTVAVTNEPASPLAALADYTLLCNTEREISVAATKTFMAQMFILARLTAAWCKDSGLKKELSAVGGLLAKNYKYLVERAETLSQRYRFMTDGFTLGRGYLYPVALEAALKLKETNYIRMQGAAASDFRHGPLAQADESTPSFVYAMNGPVFDDTVALADTLTSVGSEVCVITDNAELAVRFEQSVLVRSGASDVSAAFQAVLFAQLFAASMADTRGKNPDAPRALKKVTITK